MRFEQIDEDKIQVILSSKDLIENNINLHDFMANPLQSQDVFVNILKKANQQIGFSTKNYKVKIQAIAMASNTFVIAITRFSAKKDYENYVLSDYFNKVTPIHKKENTNSSILIYNFICFEDFCKFVTKINFIYNNDFPYIAKKVNLYFFKNSYFLVFIDLNKNFSEIKSFFTLITDFATYLNNSEVFIKKLNEYGKIVMKHNALVTCSNFFVLK